MRQLKVGAIMALRSSSGIFFREYPNIPNFCSHQKASKPRRLTSSVCNFPVLCFLSLKISKEMKLARYLKVEIFQFNFQLDFLFNYIINTFIQKVPNFEDLNYSCMDLLQMILTGEGITNYHTIQLKSTEFTCFILHVVVSSSSLVEALNISYFTLYNCTWRGT